MKMWTLFTHIYAVSTPFHFVYFEESELLNKFK